MEQWPAPPEWPELLRLRAGKVVGTPDTPSAAWDLYAPIARGRAGGPFVVAQLGQSLDGRIATVTGHSRYINGPEALVHLHRVRALVDAVVVGVGTVIADDPQLTVRSVEGSNPVRVVIDPNGRLPPGARMLSDGAGPVVVVQARPTARLRTVEVLTVEPDTDGRLPPGAVATALHDRGLGRLLIEGGASTVSAFLAAGAVDRLHLSVAPVLIGAGPIGINLPPIEHMDQALRPPSDIHRLGGDVLFDCRLRAP